MPKGKPPNPPRCAQCGASISADESKAHDHLCVDCWNAKNSMEEDIDD